MSKYLSIILLMFGGFNTAFADTVYLQHALPAAQADYAADIVSDALKEKSFTVTGSADGSDFIVKLGISSALDPEAFSISSANGQLDIEGGDQRGLIYAAFEVAEQLRDGKSLNSIESKQETPALPFRALKHNLPWDSYRSSSALDLHYDTVKDVKYWEAFLDMMAENRFNALTLWNLHPFPYMIKAKNFPEATRFSDKELAEWRKFYQEIFAMAKERGIDTYLVNWNVLVSKEFADAHDLEGTNYFPYYKGRADYKGEAQTSEVVKRYTKESVTQVLEEYPNLTGFGFSFGEQMGAMTPKERQDWMDETIIAGMQAADRPTKMIFRAPFSSGLGQGGSTDKATEELTRDAIEKLGDHFDGPIWMEIKFNWSHAHSTPELVKVHGGELKDTYFKPTPENYKVAWMVRNEDFFALRWGHPDFIREHLKLNAHHDYVGGYFVGSESYIPAKDYFTAIDQPVDWTYAFERQWLFYKLWGRLLYNPETPDSVFEAEFVHRYGESAKPLLTAYEAASETQLKFATATDFTWDFTIYGEGMMVMSKSGMEPMSVERLIVQPTLKDNWLSVQDFVEQRQAGEQFDNSIVTPLILANRMEADSTKALQEVKDIDTSENPSLMYEVADVKIWANLGLYYAEKLRGAVALATFRTQGEEREKQAAVNHLQNSLSLWDEVIAISRPIYKDMPLMHNNRPNNQRVDNNLFHWALIRPAIVSDIQVAKESVFKKE
ncbi:hypothetical protein [Pseudomaricurvus sp.]|uniref:hypothetical protein n=1 Tax=Pseudomaricurvus sp. TaxID=2004510 RepID=UPI003F6A8C5D